MHSRAARWIGSSLLLVLTLLVALPIYLFPLFELPEPDGPYPVGTRSFELEDSSRKGVMYSPREEPRRLPVRVWYPATGTESLEPRPYFTRQEAWDQGGSMAAESGLPRFLYLHLSDVDTHSYEGAPVARAKQRFPVVVFNHGFSLYAAQNTALMEHLASHSYVVFSMGHPYDSATLRFADGTLVDPQPLKKGKALEDSLERFTGGESYERRYEAYEDFRKEIGKHRVASSVRAWRDDSLFLMEALRDERVPDAIQELARRIDAGSSAYVGMSFGGATAPTTCHVDPRCKAALDLDGMNWDLDLYDADLGKPLLLVHSDWLEHPLFPKQPKDASFNPNDYSYEAWAHASQRKDIYRMRLRSIAHGGFTDLVLSMRPILGERLYGSIDASRAVAAVNDLALGFLDTYLKGRSTGFPQTLLARYPELIPHDASGVRSWWVARGEAQTGEPAR